MEGWKQLSFKENNMNIDRARSFCENHIVEKFGDIYNCYPMEVYCKEDKEGKTFKVLILGKHLKNEEFKIFSACTYVKEEKRPQPEFKEDTFKSNDGTDCTLTDEKKAKIKNAINSCFKGEKDFQCIKFFENALDGANVYVAKVDGKYAGIYEIGNYVKVDCCFQ